MRVTGILFIGITNKHKKSVLNQSFLFCVKNIQEKLLTLTTDYLHPNIDFGFLCQLFHGTFLYNIYLTSDQMFFCI